MPRGHPHILKLCSDQHSPFVWGGGGDPIVRTPNLDRLAERGVVYDNHYCASPLCVPGRYSMISGRLPREIGTPFYESLLPLDTPTYMRHFAQHGYQTTCVGKMHFHGPEQMYGWMFRPYGDMQVHGHSYMPGYDVANDVTGGKLALRKAWADMPSNRRDFFFREAGPGDAHFQRFDMAVTREAVEHLKAFFHPLILDQHYKEDRPLLFEVSWKCPHDPFIAPAEFYELYRDRVPAPSKPRPGDLPAALAKKADLERDIPDWFKDRCRTAYWALCHFVDFQIGVVLDALEQLGLEDEFIITYTSDHGEMAGEHGLWAKQTFYEESVRVPMIVAGPGIPNGVRVKENTSHVDLFPTLCDLAGLPQSEQVRGRSILPLIGSDTFGERTVTAELFDRRKGELVTHLMAKRGDLKYCRYDGQEQLFDLASDPGEMRNRIGDPALADAAAELRKALDQLPPVQSVTTSVP